ncbi:PEP/pyruvate-binding domain-containing protein [Nitrospira lenta]|uniref:Putative Phosphoenolpyruvate synthase n=1 Tax=Nitrospira lenta TaxID=1436998 RepID=A0A330L277_9BACT|nr:PEP/pyruvate-binding domain-containing protein [Nitrospira lenta]SPP63855.1 putative Phosphoenolpyruvate synthase [Nitrospira lenta]
MPSPLVLPLKDCTNRFLAGGKAAGLARLLIEGFPVPHGFCLTVEAYRKFLRDQQMDAAAIWRQVQSATGAARVALLEDCRRRIQEGRLTGECLTELERHLRAMRHPVDQRWAVRSSATNEDETHASFAGLYHTELGVAGEQLGSSVQAVWASLWDESVATYYERIGWSDRPPAMAVVIQPVLDAHAAGVLYTIHPVTGRQDQAVVNAVPGLAAGLVDGTMTSDQFTLQWDTSTSRARVQERVIAKKERALRLGAAGVCDQELVSSERERPSLTDEELETLVQLGKRVETALDQPVDIEWVMDRQGLWFLQARPVTVVSTEAPSVRAVCEWSRTNFKETMPDVPSPLGISFLEQFMDLFLMGPYRRLGCQIPPGMSSVRVYRGRPYLNVSLMHALIEQLRGDTSTLAEHMGGHTVSRPLPVKQLSPVALLRAGFLAAWWIRQAARQSEPWFADMKRMGLEHHHEAVQALTLVQVRERIQALNEEFIRREMTFGIAGGVTQCLQALGFLLPRWLGTDWRGLLNAALQGQAQVISAQQIIRLAELVEVARREEPVRRLFERADWDGRAAGQALRGTQFWGLFEQYLADYGHRGLGESDIMSPRFADQPEVVLDVLRHQIIAPTAQSPTDIAARQRRVREQGCADIRARCGRLRWMVFSWWYRRLCRFYALREANRHHLMYYAGATRRLLMRAGVLLTEQDRLDQAEDVFFIRVEEQQPLLSLEARDWRALVQSRKQARARDVQMAASDQLIDGAEELTAEHSPDAAEWRGVPISAGFAMGPARVIRTVEDWKKVTPGDILVAPVIDPGMAPLFGIAAGLVVEMGGTLSHGAIIAREYGLPAVANIPGITTVVRDGEVIELDAAAGVVRRRESVRDRHRE